MNKAASAPLREEQGVEFLYQTEVGCNCTCLSEHRSRKSTTFAASLQADFNLKNENQKC